MTVVRRLLLVALLAVAACLPVAAAADPEHPRALRAVEAEFREAIRLDPNYFYAQRCLGIALQSKGDIGAAVKAFRKALKKPSSSRR